MQTIQTLEEIVSQGRELLVAGDRANAYVYFVTATQLQPRNEQLWGLRAEATDDPEETAHCLEQVLEINPQNTAAREKLIFYRTSSLQQQAFVHTNATPSTRPTFNLGFLTFGTLSLTQSTIIAIIAILGLCMVLCISVPSIALITNSPIVAQFIPDKPDIETPMTVAYTLPPTWTPVPTRPPTVTPSPTPIPVWTITRSVNVRSGPGSTFPVIGSLPQNSTVIIVGRSSDAAYVQIQYPDENKLAWVSSDFVAVGKESLQTFAAINGQPTPPATRKPTVVPTEKPLATPIPKIDFYLGRPAEYVADCSKPWKVMGTIYDSAAGTKRLNGTMVRVWVSSQLQGTTTSGSMDYNVPGYWEWSFNRNSEIAGEVAVVNADGSLRSQPTSFNLTSRCDGAGAVNQIILDFVGK